jgi:photosystem II stability/assembly factor-like uncharacterized protein
MKTHAARAACLVLVAGAAFGADVDPALLAGMKARAIGPAGMSGRIAAIDAVESDPATVFVGAATGGVWKSVNGGLTWEPVFDKEPVAAIGAVAIFQANPAIVWVGTGEGNVRNSASVGNGVYRSTDGGHTWKHLGLDGSERIARIVLHPDDPDVAWVAALGREWGENPERGVFKTDDGGATWKKVLYVDERTGAADLAIDPASPNTLLAAMWQFRRWPFFFRSGGPGSGLFASHDGGATWKKRQEEDGLPKGPLGRIGVAYCRTRPNVVYALVEAETSALIRSEDGGRTFTTVNDKPNVAPRPFYYADIRVDPDWPNRVYSLDYDVRVSDDGGRTFASLPACKDIHGDYHAMWIDPRHPDHFLLGDDGGVGESRDRGRTMRFVANLPLAQFYHIAVDGESPYNVMGGMQDNGSWHGPSSTWEDGGIRSHRWVVVGGGDGYDVQADPGDPLTGYAMSQGGALVRWDQRTGVQRPIKPPQGDGAKLRFNWNTGLALDPFTPGTVYYGSQFLHRSTDRGDTWTTISPDLTSNNPEWQRQDDSGGLTTDVTAAENYCTILAIAPSPRERGVIWVGTDDGRIQLTRDGGATWTSVEANVKGVPANTWIPHIKASRFDAGEAFVVFDDHRRSNWTPYVYRTADYGKTWTSLATPELRGWALVVEQDAVKRDLLFLGTEFGLYVSLDGGKRWLPFRHGVPTVSVMDIAEQERDGDLVLGTHGRSALIIDDIRPLRALTAEVLAESIHLFAAGDAQQHANRPEAGGFGLGAGEFRGENRPYGAILTYSLNLPDLPLPDPDKEKERREKERAAKLAAGYGWGPSQPKRVTPETPAPTEEKEPKATVRVLDAAGATIRTFKGPAKLGINRAVWDLRRDAFKQFPRLEERPQESEPAGPEVPPGSYTVVLSYGEREARGTLTVLADPRAGNTAADWQRRWQAILAAGKLRDVAVDAVRRVRDTRTDVAAVLTRVRTHATAEATPGEAADQGKKTEEQPLVKAGRALIERLTAIEKRLWAPPETVGIVAENDAVSPIFEAAGALEGSWAPPTPSDQARLDLAQAKLAAVLQDLDALFATEVAAYRRDVDAAGIRLLAPVEPLQPAGG